MNTQSRRLKVGVIGLGEVAQIIHLPILQQLSDRYEVAALCDISPGLLKQMGERYKVERLYDNAYELAAQDDLDAVFVLNSNEYHTECAVAAAKHGKHVLIEKPMCMTIEEAHAIIAARDEAKVQIMVGYMRRFAPAFIRAKAEIHSMKDIRFAKIRACIGPNHFFINQSSNVLRFNDISPEAIADRQQRFEQLVHQAIGDVPPGLARVYALLCGLSSHDLSAMRELIGVPKRVISASQSRAGRYYTALLDYGDFHASFETGGDGLGRFDAHIEVQSELKSVKVQYNTPYIRHLPTEVFIQETTGEEYKETRIRPTYRDPYTCELEHFYNVIVNGEQPKTSPEDSIEDLLLFRSIIKAMQRS